MARKLRSLRTALFAGVGAALLFGAGTVRAEVRGPACSDFLADAACTTQSGCQKMCQTNFSAAGGSCSNYCCYCIWF